MVVFGNSLGRVAESVSDDLRPVNIRHSDWFSEEEGVSSQKCTGANDRSNSILCRESGNHCDVNRHFNEVLIQHVRHTRVQNEGIGGGSHYG